MRKGETFFSSQLPSMVRGVASGEVAEDAGDGDRHLSLRGSCPVRTQEGLEVFLAGLLHDVLGQHGAGRLLVNLISSR